MTSNCIRAIELGPQPLVSECGAVFRRAEEEASVQRLRHRRCRAPFRNEKKRWEIDGHMPRRLPKRASNAI